MFRIFAEMSLVISKVQKIVVLTQLGLCCALLLFAFRRASIPTLKSHTHSTPAPLSVRVQKTKKEYTSRISYKVVVSVSDLEDLFISVLYPSKQQYIQKTFHTPDIKREKFSLEVPKLEDKTDDIVSSFLHKNELWESHITEPILCLLQKCRDKYESETECMFVDVGANVGSIAVPVAARKFKVFAFEANNKNVGTLLYSKLTNINENVKQYLGIYPFAAGNGSSVAHLDADPLHILNTRILGTGEVPSGYVRMGSTLMGRVDMFIPTDARVYGIKIDTEGYEYMALLGMTKLLEDPYLKFIALDVFIATERESRGYVKTDKLKDLLFGYGFTCMNALTSKDCRDLKPGNRDSHMALFTPPRKDIICIRPL